jgi:acyl carrier protein
MSSTFEQLQALLVQRFDADAARITPDVAVTDMGLDSLTLMEFIFAAEDHFALRLPEEKLDPRQAGLTLAEVAAAIDQELAQKQAGA